MSTVAKCAHCGKPIVLVADVWQHRAPRSTFCRPDALGDNALAEPRS